MFYLNEVFLRLKFFSVSFIIVVLIAYSYKNSLLLIFSFSLLKAGSTNLTILNNTPPKVFSYKIINEYPHDITSYTQGLEFYEGELYESTGQRGESKLRKVNYKTGDVLKNIDLAFLDYKINNFGVVLNMTVSEMQAKLNFNKFQSITQKFLDVNLTYLGHVNSSQRIRNSIISRTPLMSKNNKNSDTKYFENISQALSRLDSNNTGSIKFFD